ncbi:RHS repeat-associated core domain-containing protein [Vibrio coralliilyticus]|uniref:RHS repeat-associated core domain-containing protein n=1 Tax=Vibrio coralliilyticus TaxID=190893 RepID=UPI0020B82087|nr:RHS repeat-associated core domain-containing protein [Vibrio coralliilyticus]
MSTLPENKLRYCGERKDPVAGLYHLGNGYRAYSPSIMRFHSADSMSPFGRGGINKYAYCLGDPINKRDPSGHFAIMSILIGAIIGAVVGAGVSAIAEGVRAAATGDRFDGTQVAIGAMLGFVSGGFGAASAGLKTGAQIGLAVADTVASGAVDFGINIALGANPKDAGINAGIGSTIGLLTFGIGNRIGKAINNLRRGIASGELPSSYKYAAMDYKQNIVAGHQLEILSHGKVGLTGSPVGLKSGKAMSQFLQDEFSDQLDRISTINYLACGGANGGSVCSQAQIIANKLGKPTKAYYNKISIMAHNTGTGQSRVFRPQHGVRRRITSVSNKLVGGIVRGFYYTKHPSWAFMP